MPLARKPTRALPLTEAKPAELKAPASGIVPSSGPPCPVEGQRSASRIDVGEGGVDRPYLVVVRGLPGSGKSTWAKEMFPAGQWVIYETDHLFCDIRGEYRFDAQLWDQAEVFTRSMVDRALADRRNVVIVDVLETRAKVEVYAALAKYHGAQFAVFTRAGEYGSIHKVPLYVRQEMLARWQDYACERADESLAKVDDLVRG